MLIRRQAMVENIRTGHNGAFTVKLALQAVKGEKTLPQLSSKFGVHAKHIGQWHKQLRRKLPTLSSDPREKQDRDQEDLVPELTCKSGSSVNLRFMEVQLDWLMKRSQMCLSKENGN
jgi:transposase